MRKTATLFFSCLTLAVFAQGSGADGAVTISSTVFADAVRSQMTANSSGATVTVADNSAFAVNDVCLVIQMRGTGAGNYEEATISSKSGGDRHYFFF